MTNSPEPIRNTPPSRRTKPQFQSAHGPKQIKRTPSRAAKKAAQVSVAPKPPQVNTKRRNIITIAAIAIVVLLIGAFAYYLIAIAPLQRAILTINNEDISTNYFLKRVVANPNGSVSSTLQGLVGEYIIKQQAAANGVAPVTDADIDTYLRDGTAASLAAQAATGDTTTTTTPTTKPTITDEVFNKWFQEQLSNTGLSAKEYRVIIEHEILRNRLADILSSDIPATATQINLWAIQYTSQAAATAAKAKINTDADFILASAAAGTTNYDQGWWPYAALDNQFMEAVKALAIGKCSDPIPYVQSSSTASTGTTTTYLLMMVHESKDNVPLTTSQINTLKSKGLYNWLNEQLKTTKIVIHEQNGQTSEGVNASFDNTTLTYLNFKAQELVSKRPKVTTTDTSTTSTGTTTTSPAPTTTAPASTTPKTTAPVTTTTLTP